MRYLARRLSTGLLLLLAVSLAAFALAEAAPGDFLAEMRLDPRISPEAVDALKARYGLDRPLGERYLSWLGSALTGELGYSFTRNVPVGPLVAQRAANTLLLTALATACAWLLALPLGAWGAYRPGGWVDRAGQVAAAALLATPSLLLGLGCLLLAVRSGLFPTGGMVSPGAAEMGTAAAALDLAHHLVLPVAALTLAALPGLLRHVRAAVAEALAAPFALAARCRGVPPHRLLAVHALPAAANPLISLLGLSIGRLLSGSLVVEVLLSWPGIGTLLVESALARDLHLLVGVLLLSGVLLLAGNLLADALLHFADPRTRTPARGEGAA